MRRMHASLLSVLFALSASGASVAELEGFLPLQPKPAGKPTGQVRLRGSHNMLLYAPQQGAELTLRVQAVQIGRYETEILAHGRWPGAPKLVLKPPRAGGPSEGVLVLRAPGRGVVSVALNTSANAAIVTAPAPHGWLLLEASARTPLHVISRCERLHFFVPKATRSFTVFGRGGGGRENCRLTVFAPDGSQAGQASGEGSRTVRVRVQVPEAQRGAVWSLKADKPPKLDGVFEDAYVWLSDDVPAYVSPQPDGLLVPFVHGLVQPPMWRQKDAPTPIELSLNIQPPAGARLHVVLGAYATVIAKTSVA
ncbi:hypothetical protein HQ576_11210, partial [bacterium]|nr:hypothetical protein [bacterium]